jgi:hypothetical protein
LKLLDAGIYAAAWQNVTGYLAADEMTGLKPVLNLLGIFLEIP